MYGSISSSSTDFESTFDMQILAQKISFWGFSNESVELLVPKKFISVNVIEI